jgi:hypothetical protein
VQGTGETLVLVITIVLVILGVLVVLSVVRLRMLRHRYRLAVTDIESDSRREAV